MTQEDEILYPETKKCLESLKEKYKIGIIANQISGTEDRLKEFGISQYIDLVIASAEEIIDTDSEPDIDLNIGCKKPYDCSFFAYCSRKLPKPSVFNLYRQSFSKKLDYYYSR